MRDTTRLILAMAATSLASGPAPLQAETTDPVAVQESAAPTGRSHTIAGELVMVDLPRRSLTLRTGRKEVREIDLLLDEAETRITWAGRLSRIEELRPGEHLVVSCWDDEAGRHHTRLIKVGPSRYAAPASGPLPR